MENVRSLVAGDVVLLDLLDRAEQRPACLHRDNAVDNINSTVDERPVGTSATAGLRRLRKDRPDLHAQVLANELSVHRACVEAGFRKVARMPIASIENEARENLATGVTMSDQPPSEVEKWAKRKNEEQKFRDCFTSCGCFSGLAVALWMWMHL